VHHDRFDADRPTRLHSDCPLARLCLMVVCPARTPG
jgi:hypothetical protein